MSEPSCATCRFWVRLGEGNVGDCRKNAPTLVREGHPFNMRIWPNTYDIDWCDEHKRLKELKQKSKAEAKPEVESNSNDPHEREAKPKKPRKKSEV